jgi:hypothetical protein
MICLLFILCLSFDYFYPQSGMKAQSFIKINIGSGWTQARLLDSDPYAIIGRKAGAAQ